MLRERAKRFTIIGLPGSGKSTFAILLGKTLDISVHHLDQHMFKKEGTKKDKKLLSSFRKDENYKVNA